MGIWDRMRGRSTTTTAVVEAELVEPGSGLAVLGAEESMVVRDAVGQLRGAAHYVTEAYGAAELALENAGWKKLTADGSEAITRQGLRSITSVARVMARANPLIRRGLALRVAYVWGEGVNITARAAGDGDSEQDVNAVVQELIDDEGNQRAWFGEQAREEHERALGTDGNVFTVLFTLPTSGAVNVRTLPWDEIEDVITNPEDRSEPWYYVRIFEQPVQGTDGEIRVGRQAVLYPDIDYRPRTRLRSVTIRGQVAPIRWDAPVIHTCVNRLDGDKFGIGDVYTALAPARAYMEFVQDWAQLMKALARFTWRRTGNRNGRTERAAQAVSAAAAAAEAASARLTKNRQGPLGVGESRAGGLYDGSAGDQLEAIPKTGATIDAESARPLGALVAAGVDLPVTMLLADPGVTGARATAETLDKPNELLQNGRRRRWAATDRRILAYAIGESVRAPAGQLRGQVVRSVFGRERVDLGEATSADVDINFPPLEKVDPAARLQALKIADDIVGPSIDILRLVLEAIGVEDVDAALDELTDDNGNLIDRSVQAGVDAVAAHLAGLDAASTDPYAARGAAQQQAGRQGAAAGQQGAPARQGA